jgi:hypothetical protein
VGKKVIPRPSAKGKNVFDVNQSIMVRTVSVKQRQYFGKHQTPFCVLKLLKHLYAGRPREGGGVQGLGHDTPLVLVARAVLDGGAGAEEALDLVHFDDAANCCSLCR